MKIAVVGIGYVGLSNAVLLAQHHDVVLFDTNSEKVSLVVRGESPIEDVDIIHFLQEESLHLTATNHPEEAYRDADYIIIATPTDYNSQSGSFDTSTVKAVARDAAFYAPNACIVLKSTIPVGFTDVLREELQLKNILFAPEFLREGHALYDNLHPSRMVFGIPENEPSLMAKAEILADAYKNAAKRKDVPVFFMTAAEAECVKLFSNTYLALRVAYFNELDTYAEMRGLNTQAIIEGVGADPRIGTHYNNPSFGYGGYCLPKDTKQLLSNYDKVPNNIITSIVEANRTRKDFIVDRILSKVGWSENQNVVIGIYRLTMKQDSDNFRNSSVQGIMKRLQEKQVKTLVYEPTLRESMFYGCRVLQDLSAFKRESSLIIANRYHKELDDVKDKLYTRDLYNRD